MIKAIKFVSIPVRDQAASLRFYTEKLGFRVHTDQPFGEKQRWIELRIGKAETGFVLFNMEGDEDLIGRGFHGSLTCDDLDSTYNELIAKGVEFVSPPTEAPWGAYCIFQDIDGNRFVMSAA
jgi:catechol 2,3-dioxygenase-like lactoylglutathione lyase family enzyme